MFVCLKPAMHLSSAVRAIAIVASLCLFDVAEPAFAVAPTVQQFMHGFDALQAYAKVEPEARTQYSEEHREELMAAVQTVEYASDVLRYTLSMNSTIIFKYGHAVVCNYDEETGPKVDKLVANHIARLIKTKVPPNEARRATMALLVDELVLGEMMDEFPCPVMPAP